MQSKRWSAIEQAINVGTGFLIAQGLILYILPLFDLREITLHDSVLISMIFTSVSFVRGYICRRAFNRLNRKVNNDNS